MEKVVYQADYIFETSWEVCNKVGGIHTVITSKTRPLVEEWGDRLIMLGPDTWKGEGKHPEFEEDPNLFTSWRPYALAQGLKVKIGRWKIAGNPIVILIDFTPYFVNKDEILSDLWLRYKVDSLTGAWDYIEPALFGYAAGKVIECYYHFHLTFSDRIIAQFHEWITGVGVLYLDEHVPQIGTVFTTHATVVGRSIAGNGLALYSKFDSFNAEHEARNFNVIAKHSLEKVAAMKADCFTTVSEITAKECIHFLGKKPDVLTPNGYDDFIVPDNFFFKEKRALARKKLFDVAEALLGYKVSEDSILLIKSGRYEFRNKGIDIFIDTLGELCNNNEMEREIIAFIFVPAHCTGPRKDIVEKLENGSRVINQEHILTHNLQGAEYDPILLRIKQNGLNNDRNKKVKICFAPVYLSGNDGIFNLTYYELLIGFDLSAFPSYYEPWGYTPLESLAFHVPTITTSLTGFGMILQGQTKSISEGIAIINRTDDNDKAVVTSMASTILEFLRMGKEAINRARESAFLLSKTALWKNYIGYYKQAYSLALAKTVDRSDLYRHMPHIHLQESKTEMEFLIPSMPSWRKIFVQSQLPDALKTLNKIAKNLWWTWNFEAIELFKMIDVAIWEKASYNPLVLLDSISYTQIKRLERNKDFLLKLNQVGTNFNNYLNKPRTTSPHVVYFSMEYGFSSFLKLYSGGLGILAGDYLKEASDNGDNITGIGLLYRKGYFKQEISRHGEQLVKEDVQKFTNLPLSPVFDKENNWIKVGVAFPGRIVYAKVWQVEIGSVLLYLLDTDIIENRIEDRDITGNLYGGDWENRLKQELLLGIGGIHLLKSLELNPEVYHYNEGHAAFASLERILNLVQEENLSFETAKEVVKSSTLFTTHTPVPAGHDVFKEELLRMYLADYATLLNISWKHLMSLGKIDGNNPDEKFSMSILAAEMAQDMNGVSLSHQNISRAMFNDLWKGYACEELPIGHVTNGVHFSTWVALEWYNLYTKYLGNGLMENLSSQAFWKKINEVPTSEIWRVHKLYKMNLLNEIKSKIRNDVSIKTPYARQILQKISALGEDTFIIGFARRFVGYKRATLLFNNQDRLRQIINNSKVPVLFLFAGKAHANDFEGQELIKTINEIAVDEKFLGHILFLEDYDIDLARYLTQGADIWFNTPVVGMEASGTSGMKAAINGILNFSALDGWWSEAYNGKNGWTFSNMTTENNPYIQDEIDSENIYQILENEILPLYLKRDKDNLPIEWVEMVKASIQSIVPYYNTARMLREYQDKYYSKLSINAKKMNQNQYELSGKLADWKKYILERWDTIKIVSMEIFDSVNKAFPLGSDLAAIVVVDCDGLSESDFGVEIIFINKRNYRDEIDTIVFKKELEIINSNGTLMTFSCKIPLTQSGVYEYGFRIFPKNALMCHRQDFPLLKWI